MGRVVAADVTAIIDTKLTDAEIDIYITSANVFVTDALGTKGLSNEVLKEIERWTTAHFIAVSRERSALKEEAGSAKVEYSGDYGKDFDSTLYGQTAQSLDSSGTLAARGNKVAKLYAISNGYS